MRATLVLAVLALSTAAHGEDSAQRFKLDNGLRVILRPAPQAKNIACVVLFDLGEANDPPGKSGLSHLTEHVYVTAAAGSRPASTAAAWMTRYAGSNAQTGR